MNTKMGWTPCGHFQNCVGWCPRCLQQAQKLDQPATLTFVTNDPEFVALLETLAGADASMREAIWGALRK